MIINGQSLFVQKPIVSMEAEKIREHGVSYGLGEAGYDIRLKQTIHFHPDYEGGGPAIVRTNEDGDIDLIGNGRFVLASAIEEFNMPLDLVAIVHDKSTWARQGVSVFNTVIEPGWKGFLTLEIVFHGNRNVVLPAGCGIAQVLFHQVAHLAQYEGKYQNQEDEPVSSKFE